MSTAVVVTVAAVAGAAWGLVMPGLVGRFAVEWPDGQPRPPWRRSCPSCGAPRPSWWRSSGRCAACGHRPTPGRAVTVPVAAAVFAAVAAAVGPVPALPAFLVLAAGAVPLALVDLKVLRLPDPLVAAVFLGGVVGLVVATAVTGRTGPLLRAGAAVVLCGLLYAVLAVLARSQLGLGDVKLGAVLGLYLGWLGWTAVAAGILLAPLVNLPFVIGLLVTRRAGRATQVPYGPAMLAAAIVALPLSDRWPPG